MKEIIEKLEKATGPDRRLDVEIDCAIRFPALRPARKDDHKEHQRGFPPSEGDIYVPTGFLMANSYTSSIDAALTLVPEDCYADLIERCAESCFGTPGRFRAVVNYWGDERYIGDTHDVRDIALCIAALRARSDGGEG